MPDKFKLSFNTEGNQLENKKKAKKDSKPCLIHVFSSGVWKQGRCETDHTVSSWLENVLCKRAASGVQLRKWEHKDRGYIKDLIVLWTSTFWGAVVDSTQPHRALGATNTTMSRGKPVVFLVKLVLTNWTHFTTGTVFSPLKTISTTWNFPSREKQRIWKYG